ncbi:hypothetical protein C8A03DRAFT_39614, partial [Achaetomium macrosporum]
KVKILYAATLLTGSAGDGVSHVIEKINANSNDDSKWPFKTGQEFMTHLAGKYATMDLEADAENKLRDLDQSGKFANFTDFLTQFVNLADICDWDAAARVRFLREKTSKEMRRAFAVQINVPAKDDFAGWVRMAQQLAVNAEAERQREKTSNGHHANHGGGGGGGKAKNNDDKGDPMDIDAIKINKMSAQERERRRSMGLCFNCGRAGHLVANCPNPTKTGGRNDGNGNRGRGGRGGSTQGNQQRDGQANSNKTGEGNTNQYWYAQAAPFAGFPGGYPGPHFNQPQYPQYAQQARRGGARGGYPMQQVRMMQVPVFPAGFAHELPDDASSTDWHGNNDDGDQGQGNA